MCLVDSLDQRDLSLLNSVQSDSYFYFFLERFCVSKVRVQCILAGH